MAKYKYKEPKYEKSGFIVHGNWTGSGKYQAAYGKTDEGYNKRARQFKTMKKAKAFLRKKGVKSGIKKTESGRMTKFTTKATRKRAIRRRRSLW